MIRISLKCQKWVKMTKIIIWQRKWKKLDHFFRFFLIWNRVSLKGARDHTTIVRFIFWEQYCNFSASIHYFNCKTLPSQKRMIEIGLPQEKAYNTHVDSLEHLPSKKNLYFLNMTRLWKWLVTLSTKKK